MGFDEVIKGKDYYVKFYAPWCGHCKKMIPTWEELASADNGINVAKVDCTVHKELATQYGVEVSQPSSYSKQMVNKLNTLVQELLKNSPNSGIKTSKLSNKLLILN